MERWKGKVALVTGASSGIGYDIAKQLALLGMKVIGCARNITTIETLGAELQSTSRWLVGIKCDLTKEEEIMDMFQFIRRQYGDISVCVYSAGVAHVATLLEGKTEDWRDMFEVNVLGLSICTREAVKLMKETHVNDGHLIFINRYAAWQSDFHGSQQVPFSSHGVFAFIYLLLNVGGYRVTPTKETHFYSVTKHAVTAIAEAVRQELREIQSGIKVTSIAPGLVRTGLRARMMKQNIEEGMKELDSLCKDVLEVQDITECVVYALSTPPNMEVHEFMCRPTYQKF